MTPPNRKSCYNFRVVEINRVLDGDTIDVTIDLGFDLYKKERVRIAGVDTPENAQETLRRNTWNRRNKLLKEKLDGAISGDDDLVIRTGFVGCWEVWSSSRVVIHWGRRCVTQRTND